MSVNYKVLSGLKISKSVIDLFVSTFFVMYFISLSNDNLVSLTFYYLILYFVVYATIFVLRNFCKSPKRIYLLRIGIILNFVYFLCIFFLKENIVNFVWFIAVVYGLEEGFYFSVYNNFEATGINNNERQKFLGTVYAINSILSIVVPFIFGSVMSTDGFDKCIIIVLILVVLQIVCSFVFKDVVIDKKTKTNLKCFVQFSKINNKVRQICKLEFFNGMIYSGAFNSVVAIYIINAFNDSFGYGIFTSVFAVITTIVGFYFAKFIKHANYIVNLKISGFLTSIGILLIMINCNFITIVIFNLLLSYSKTIMKLINDSAIMNIANIKPLRDNFKVEYFLGTETFLVIGRTIGYLLLFTLALFNTYIWSNVILFLFMVSILLFTKISVNLQQIFNKDVQK